MTFWVEDITHIIDSDVLIKLEGMGTVKGGNTGITSVGQYFFNTIEKKIFRCTSFVSSTNFKGEIIPFYDGAIYTYNNELYVWNGTELIKSYNELELFREAIKIIGQGETLVYKDFILIKGLRYRIIFDNPSWQRNEILDPIKVIFAINSFKDNIQTRLLYITKSEDSGTLSKSYGFVVPSDSEYVRFYFRGNQNVPILFNILQLDNNQTVNSITLIGDGSNLVYENVVLENNKQYEIVLNNPDWERNDTGSSDEQIIFSINSVNQEN